MEKLGNPLNWTATGPRSCLRRWLLIVTPCILLGQIYFFTHLSTTNSPQMNYPGVHSFAAGDIDGVNYWAKQFKLRLLLIDPLLLPSIENGTLKLRSSTFCAECDSTILLAGDFKDIGKIKNMYDGLTKSGFKGNILRMLSENQNVTVGLEVRRVSTIVVAFLHTREANTWWTGTTTALKTNRVKLTIFREEKLLDKFKTSPVTINNKNRQFLYPKSIGSFLENWRNAKFVICNRQRAEIFYKKYGKDASLTARKFRHRSSKLISRVKNILDRLEVTFWLSSGTCLGFYRECDIIAHSKDVDIGVFAQDFRQDMVTALERGKIRLTNFFGELNDSLELSFVDENEIKLDIFFFYKENDTYWNGGTQARTGKKFKYVFPKFELCWTLFLDMKLRVPCDTKKYIYANYGPSWNERITEWDWKKSPFNVQENGYWPENKRKFFV